MNFYQTNRRGAPNSLLPFTLLVFLFASVSITSAMYGISDIGNISIYFSKRIDGRRRYSMPLDSYGSGRIAFEAQHNITDVEAKLESSRDGTWCYIEMQLPTAYAEGIDGQERVALPPGRGGRISSRFSDRITFTGDLERAIAVSCDTMSYPRD